VPDFFSYRGGALYCEDVPAQAVAEKLGTPLYLYSKAAFLNRLREIREAFAATNPAICYSVKANSNLALLKLVAQQGEGFDIVSGGELYRVLKAGGPPGKTVYAGVGKTAEEVRYALENDIWMFNVECESELDDIARIAREMGKVARVALRVNPGVAADTHHHIATGKKESKFGLEPGVAEALAKRAANMKSIQLVGLHAHIGSQITDTLPHRLTFERLNELARLLEKRRLSIEYINIGGGFGIRYRDEQAPPAKEFAAAIEPLVKASGKKLILEPGRYIVGNAAILLTRVIRVKSVPNGKTFVICDAGMNDLIRPALYDAFHFIWPVKAEAPMFLGGPASPESFPKVDIVGPVCESGDYFAKHRPLPQVREGDLLAIFSAGAYGMIMSSNYNSRPRAAEALVDGASLATIRSRETYADLTSREENGSAPPRKPL
jgi:diaminopimelate decarboxylase